MAAPSSYVAAPRVIQTTTRIVTTVIREEINGHIGDLDSDDDDADADDDDDDDYMDEDGNTSIGSLSSDEMPLHPFPIDRLMGIAAAARGPAASAGPAAHPPVAAPVAAPVAGAPPAAAAPAAAGPSAIASSNPAGGSAVAGPSGAGIKRKRCACTTVVRRCPRTFIGPRRKPSYVYSSGEEAEVRDVLVSADREVIAVDGA